MIEASVVRFFIDNFDKFGVWYDLLDKKLLTRPAQILLDAMHEWREQHETLNINDVVATLMLQGLPADVFNSVKVLVNEALSIEDSEAEFTELATKLHEREIADKLAYTADMVLNGQETFDSILSIMEDFDRKTELLKAAETAVLHTTLNEAYEDMYGADSVIDWSMDFLNRNIGPIQPGTLTIIGARPDTGKTTLLLNEAANALREEKTVLFFNNEERDKKVFLRAALSVLGVTKDELDEGLVQEFNETYADRFILVNARKLHPREIELLVDEYSPDIVFFDQLYKLRGWRQNENEAYRIHGLFTWARELANVKNVPVIAAHLADAEAAGKPFPEQHMLYMGKTGPQAEADFIIMMGKDYEDDSFYRGLNIVKTKEVMPGCDPIMRCYIELDPFRVTVNEITEK